MDDDKWKVEMENSLRSEISRLNSENKILFMELCRIAHPRPVCPWCGTYLDIEPTEHSVSCASLIAERVLEKIGR